MKNQGHTFLILVITWTCFAIGCAVTAAYLNVSSQFQSSTQTTEVVQAMQVQEQEESQMMRADADDLLFASVQYFMETYYRNLKAGNRSELIKMIEDPDSYYSEEELRKIKAYIESYQDFQYYIKDTSQDEEYIVFVYFQTKLYDIDTFVPSISQFYIKQKDSEWIICNNTELLDDTAKKDLKASLSLDDIKDLIEKINKKYQQALDTDESLKKYFEDAE